MMERSSSSSSSTSSSSLVEIRPGRRIYINVIDKKKTAAEEEDRKDNKCDSSSSSSSCPVLLFVHGSCGHSGQWDFQVDWLLQQHQQQQQQQHTGEEVENQVAEEGVEPGAATTATTDFRIVRYDYFGCGKSMKPKENAGTIYTASEHYADLVAVYDRYCCQQQQPQSHASSNVWVIGHSFGGSMALRLTSEKSNISKLVLVAPAIAINHIPWILNTLPVLILGWIQSVLTYGFITAAFHPSTLANCPELIESERAASNSNPPYMFQPFYQSLVDYCNSTEANEEIRSGWFQNVQQTMIGIGGKVLILCGDDDRIVPLENARQVEQQLIPVVQFEVIGNASHQVCQEKPDAVNALLSTYLFDTSISSNNQ